jgi:hypothetical protein
MGILPMTSIHMGKMPMLQKKKQKLLLESVEEEVLSFLPFDKRREC